MYNTIKGISKRAYATAKRRGKYVDPEDCKKYLQCELNEYWDAVEAGKPTNFWRDIVSEAARMSDAEFIEMYNKRVHNTADDELADILITTATWIEAIALQRESEGNPYQTKRDVELMFAVGPIQYVLDQLDGNEDRERLVNILYLKLRYNEIRKD